MNLGKIYKYKKIELTKDSSSLEIWFNELLEKEESELTLLDVLRMLRQNIFLDLAVKKSIELLKNDIFCGEYYDGELFVTLLNLNSDLVLSNNEINKLCNKLASSLENTKFDDPDEKKELESAINNFKEKSKLYNSNKMQNANGKS